MQNTVVFLNMNKTIKFFFHYINFNVSPTLPRLTLQKKNKKKSTLKVIGEENKDWVCGIACPQWQNDALTSIDEGITFPVQSLKEGISYPPPSGTKFSCLS